MDEKLKQKKQKIYKKKPYTWPWEINPHTPQNNNHTHYYYPQRKPYNRKPK